MSMRSWQAKSNLHGVVVRASVPGPRTPRRRRRCGVYALLGMPMLFGCGPVYQTHYDYTPPTSAEGRACVTACESSRMQCEMIEQQRGALCEQQADMEYERCRSRSEDQYNACTASGRSGCFHEVCIRRSCSTSADACVQTYNRCYGTCGGNVRATEVCVSGCPNEPPRPTTAGPAPSPPPADPGAGAPAASTRWGAPVAEPAAPSPPSAPPAAGACAMNSDCPEGQYCGEGACRYDCRADRDCAVGQTCDLRNGRCQ